MPKFRKRPVVIEAWCNTEEAPHRSGVPDWLDAEMRAGDAWYAGGFHGYFTIKTLDGELRADCGDRIIKGVKGEIYPCKPDIFAATYELAE